MHIRHWTLSDAQPLGILIEDCLRETFNAGADFPPTARNVSLLWTLGLNWSNADEPTLLAENDAGMIVGYALWGPAQSQFDTREKACIGLGTYVIPHFRRHSVGLQMRNVAKEHAKARGYTVVQGAVYDRAARASVMAAGFTIMPVSMVELRL